MVVHVTDTFKQERLCLLVESLFTLKASTSKLFDHLPKCLPNISSDFIDFPYKGQSSFFRFLSQKTTHFSLEKEFNLPLSLHLGICPRARRLLWASVEWFQGWVDPWFTIRLCKHLQWVNVVSCQDFHFWCWVQQLSSGTYRESVPIFELPWPAGSGIWR